MNAGDLTGEQVKKVQEQLAPGFCYLRDLTRRMEQLGFGPNDEIFKATKQACDAIFSLNVKLHYLACEAHKREFEAERKAKERIATR